MEEGDGRAAKVGKGWKKRKEERGGEVEEGKERKEEEDEPVLAAPYCLAVCIARWALARRVEAITFMDWRA